MMTRDEAITLIQNKVPNDNLCRHMIAVGAIMRHFASRFSADPELWEITGILHDIDLGTTDDPQLHGNLGAEWLGAMGMPPAMLQAVRAHAGHVPCESPLDTVLLAGDQLSGLITACALIKGRLLANVTADTVRKRFKEKRFAAGADREMIRLCETVGIPLDEFIAEGVTAMQRVAHDLGL
ncbi:HDIG domain-containing protein [bacterium]|nr:HDIG domain-containing protein [candidate division CSSED10-310 bacterium]